MTMQGDPTLAAGQPIDISQGGAETRAWRDIWSAGQGIGAVKRIGPASDFIDRLAREYDEAVAALAVRTGSRTPGQTRRIASG